MKTLILSLLATVLVAPSLAQESAPNFPKNELKVNGFYLVVGLGEVSYERLLNKETSMGISATARFDEDLSWVGGVTPYYRWFFSKKTGAGLFMEGNSAVYLEEDYNWWGDPDPERDRHVNWGVGFALGYKFVSDLNWVGEVYLGAGRNFLHDDVTVAYPRLGFCIGRRFGS